MAVATAPASLFLHPDDNIAIAARTIPKDTPLQPSGLPYEILTREQIDLGHKVAIKPIPKGTPVRKFGQIIGFATTDIQPGQWVHVHNIEAGTLSLDYAYCSEVPPDPEPIVGRTFMGFRRPDGRAATRNYIGIISSVNCSAHTSKLVAAKFDKALLEQFPNIDGVVPLIHKGGCAMEYGGEDHLQLTRTLAGFARHANIGAYVILGLGCETGQASFLSEHEGLVQLTLPGQKSPTLPLVMNMQDLGGIRKTVNRAVEVLKELLPEANKVKRVPIPVSEIMLGLNCGGSDGNSGVTANPALGIASDILVAHGGTTVLAETPEIYGAEHLMTRRAKTREIGEKLIERIKWWEDYTAKFGVVINNNPSVGNKKGGLTTIYEKSLGAVAKGGSTALTGVYNYAEKVTAKGFTIMDTPGYDPVSVTGLVAGGANVVCFTTGRGSCFGCKPTPSIKIATNTPMYERMEDDMDINAGKILDGATLQEVGEEIFEMIVAVASGQKTKSEAQDVGEEEFAPWPIGPVL
ncbi:MAG: garD [Planctomycetaceae bacterium]|nr:garD [Planctomycetaceae bacterium]